MGWEGVGMGSYLMDKELHCGLMKHSIDGQWLQLHNMNVFNVSELYTLKWYIWYEYFIIVKKKRKKEKSCQFGNKCYVFSSI